MIAPTQIKKTQRVIQDLIEEQCELLREQGMTLSQEQDLLLQLSEHLGDSLGELEQRIEDEGEDEVAEADEEDRFAV